MTNNNLRLYTFVNFYLSSIQQGIQSAHVATSLTSKYRGKRNAASKLLQQYEDDGITLICLNGGAAIDVHLSYETYNRAFGAKSVYPFAKFEEEPGAIHPHSKAITAWGIVLPESVYNARPVEAFPSITGFSTVPQDIVQEYDIWKEGSAEHHLCQLLQGKSLAR